MADVQIFEGAIDKGLEGIVACSTAVSSFQDNTLSYRGYTIDDLAQNSTFEEVVFLLWNDRLPKAAELQELSATLNREASLDAEFLKVLKTLPTKNVHPMAWLRTAVS